MRLHFNIFQAALCAAASLFILTPSPSSAQNAPQPSAPQKLAFDVLLSQLDNPPVRLTSVAESQKRSAALRKVVKEYDDTMAPILPVLKMVATNKELKQVRYVPFVGETVGAGQDSMELAASMGEEMHHLIVLDQNYVKPLQEAAAVSVKLRASRSKADLPLAVDKFDAADQVLLAYSNACKKQADRITSYAKYLDRLAAAIPGPKIVSAPVRGSASGLKAIVTKINGIHSSVSAIQTYTSLCAQNGRLALSNGAAAPKR